MPFPWVTDVTLKNNQMVLTVKIEGFTSGERIELSGYATQNGGAFAVFNGLQVVPEPTPDGKITMYVTALSWQNFVTGHPVTVVLRAARVWVTVLEEEEEEEPSTEYAPRLPRPELAEGGMSWSKIKSAAYPAPPSTGNDGHAPAGSEASFPD